MLRVTNANNEVRTFSKKKDAADFISSQEGISVTAHYVKCALSSRMKDGRKTICGCLVEVVSDIKEGTIDRTHASALISSLDTIKYLVNRMSNSPVNLDPLEVLLGGDVLPDIATVITSNLVSNGRFSMIADYKVRLFSKKLFSISTIGNKISIHVPPLTKACVPQGYYIKVDKREVEDPGIVNGVTLDYAPQGGGTANQLVIRLANYDKFKKDGRSSKFVELTDPIIVKEVDTVGVFKDINSDMGDLRLEMASIVSRVSDLEINEKKFKITTMEQQMEIDSLKVEASALRIESEALKKTTATLEEKVSDLTKKEIAYKTVFNMFADKMTEEDGKLFRQTFDNITNNKGGIL